ARVRGIYRDPRTLTVDLELLDSVRTLQVSCHQQRSVTFLLQVLRKLSSKCGFTSALKAHEHNDRWRVFGEADLAGFTAKNIFELALDNLDHWLPRIECF